MERLQTIDVKDSLELSKAMKSGKPFYIINGEERVIAYDPERVSAEQKISAFLEEAENCKEGVLLKNVPSI